MQNANDMSKGSSNIITAISSSEKGVAGEATSTEKGNAKESPDISIDNIPRRANYRCRINIARSSDEDYARAITLTKVAGSVRRRWLSKIQEERQR